MAAELNPINSPHTLQNRQSRYINAEFNRENRILTDSSPRTSYAPSNNETGVTTVHYGRRQLLLNEIEFLTLCIAAMGKEYESDFSWKTKAFILFYVGAAVGNHLLVLAELFPFIKFILVDPQRFDLSFGNPKFKRNFELRQCRLDEKLCREFYNEYQDDSKYIRLFMSDIRSTDNDETIIASEMDLQANAHKILKPYKSYLKFRLPYVNDSNVTVLERTYLSGDIYFLIWGRSHTSETRLVVHRDSDEKIYECVSYQDQLYHFNKNERTFCYKHSARVQGFDHCYDCRAEVYVFEKYLEIYDILSSVTLIQKSKFEALNWIDSFRRMKIEEFIRFVNQQIRANRRQIDMKIILNTNVYCGTCSFSSINYGLLLADEIALRNLFGRTFRKYRLRNHDDLVEGMNRLQLNNNKNS